MRTYWLLVGFLLLGLKLSNTPTSEELVREGHHALARGDYERAATLYEQAEVYSTNPADVAFYLAAAKYHLAIKREGLSPELLEAEQLYRCCLGLSDPHRPWALCGLGNCLLRKAGSSDEGSLRSALTCYDLCLQSAGEEEALAAAARYNRERARLLLAQFLPPRPDSASTKPPGDDWHPHHPHFEEPRPAVPLSADTQGNTGDADSPSLSGDAPPDQSKGAAKNNEPPQPGKGHLPPIPDAVDVPPLSPQVAGEHLERAVKKIVQERQNHQRREENSPQGVMDW